MNVSSVFMAGLVAAVYDRRGGGFLRASSDGHRPPLQKFSLASSFHDPTVPQLDDAVAVGGVSFAMRDLGDGRAFGVKVAKKAA
jgi:hypothetical protein